MHLIQILPYTTGQILWPVDTYRITKLRILPLLYFGQPETYINEEVKVEKTWWELQLWLRTYSIRIARTEPSKFQQKGERKKRSEQVGKIMTAFNEKRFHKALLKENPPAEPLHDKSGSPNAAYYRPSKNKVAKPSLPAHYHYYSSFCEFCICAI